MGIHEGEKGAATFKGGERWGSHEITKLNGAEPFPEMWLHSCRETTPPGQIRMI